MKAPLSSKLAWLHMKCLLPSDWEIVVFSSNPKEGRLEFATREGHQARLAWLRCEGLPDVRKIMEEFQKDCLKRGDKELLKSFAGLACRDAGLFLVGVHKKDRPYQAAHYHAELKTLTIWTFPSFDETRYAELEKPVLESFQENCGEWREWSAWGLSFRLPSDFKPVATQPLPANVTIAFESPRRHRVDLHRWGLPDIVLGTRPLIDFHRKLLRASRFRIVEDSELWVNGFKAARAVVKKRGEFDMDYLYGKAWEGDALCWLDPEEQRIYAFEQVHSRKSPALEIADVLPQLR